MLFASSRSTQVRVADKLYYLAIRVFGCHCTHPVNVYVDYPIFVTAGNTEEHAYREYPSAPDRVDRCRACSSRAASSRAAAARDVPHHPREKVKELLGLLDELLGKTVIAKVELQRFVGKLNFAAGAVPQLTFMAPLWVAFASTAEWVIEG
eukprot:3690566-Amphidinium_carterae.2